MLKSKIVCFTFAYLLLLQFFFLVPNVESQESEIEWTESLGFEGTCTTEDIRNRFQVNRTVVEIIVNMSWVAEDGNADLDMWIEDNDGNFVDTAYSSQMPEQIIVKRLTTRGKWSIVVTKKACGSCQSADFTLNITLHNIILPELAFSKKEINPGDEVNMSIESEYEDIYQFFFDYGDDTDSDWIGQSFITKKYNTSGEYIPKAKVRYSDGTESDWVEAGSIEVKSDGEEDQICLWLLLWMGILSGIIFLVTFLHSRKEEG